MNTSFERAKAGSVDLMTLATNFDIVARDCTGLNTATAKTMLMNEFPTVDWLLGTKQSEVVRDMMEKKLLNVNKNTTSGKYEVELPRTLWSELPTGSASACCWQPFDFAKCAPKAELNILCLKDCLEKMDELIGYTLKYDASAAFKPLANQGETENEVRLKIDRLSMAWLTAYNITLGSLDATTDILKPFGGILAQYENPAVMNIDGGGASVLPAFDQLGCRLQTLNMDGDFKFTCHPLTYMAIKSQITLGKNGELPENWTRNGEEVQFMGIGFIRDRFIPVDVEKGTGDVFLLDGKTQGLIMGTDLLVTNDKFIDKSGLTQASEADCGSNCLFLFNYGTAFSTNANRIAVISNVSISSGCLNAVSDLGGLVNPQTIMPKGATDSE